VGPGGVAGWAKGQKGCAFSAKAGERRFSGACRRARCARGIRGARTRASGGTAARALTGASVWLVSGMGLWVSLSMSGLSVFFSLWTMSSLLPWSEVMRKRPLTSSTTLMSSATHASTTAHARMAAWRALGRRAAPARRAGEGRSRAAERMGGPLLA
jgi:hypothetical protein